jgi:uncharacterized repeat protein (TIGR01451 family)
MKNRIASVALAVAALATSGASHAATLTKAFGAAAIASGASATLTFTVDNPAGQPARTDVGFVDTLPAGTRRGGAEQRRRHVRQRRGGDDGRGRHGHDHRDEPAGPGRGVDVHRSRST